MHGLNYFLVAVALGMLFGMGDFVVWLVVVDILSFFRKMVRSY